MNKADLIQKIKQLEGISQDERSYLINLVNTKKKYGLVWEDKPEEVEEQLRTQLPVLREVVERRIMAKVLTQVEKPTIPINATTLFSTTETVNDENTDGEVEAPNHILIEGDNLYALTTLTFTHEGKIDVIYIDPPYNTGNKDFKYNDSYVDKEDSYRHSKWLSFMDKRLRIAKRLLSEKGVIFISIDDNELSQLKVLCDEIFLEENFIEYFSWTKTSTPPGLSRKSRKTVEYVLCYEKSKNPLKYQGELIDGGDAPLLNTGNNRRDILFPKESVRFKLGDNNFKSGVYEKVTLKEDIVVLNGRANKDFILHGEFKWTQETVNKEIEKGTYFLIKSEKFSIRFQRADVDTYKSPTNQIKESIISPTINKKEHGVETNEQATSEIINILGKPFFDYPKPITLVKYLINFFPSTHIKILDFFAGSGTTLHATMQLNAEDGGNRQCILVTNNENNICEEVTYERNRRVIQGYTNSKGEEVSGLSNNNLRYYKTEFVGREPNLKNKRELTRMATELLCIKEDCYEEKILDFAFTNQSDSKNIRFFEEKNTRMLIVYDDSAIETAVELIKSIIANNQVKENGIKVYVFSPGQYPFTEEFEEVLPYISLCALPDAIYKALMNVLPKNNRPIIPELEDDIDNQPELFD